MDIASVIGLLLGFGSIIVAAEVSHANMSLLYEKYEAFVLVFGGTLGAAFLSFPLHTCLMSLKDGFRIAFTENKVEYGPIIEKFARFADVARRDGLLMLENQLSTVNDPSVRRAIEMMIDGQSAETIRTVLDTETDVAVAQLREIDAFFCALGGFSPTLGIIGTVLGLIAMLGKLGALTDSGNVAGSIGGETAAAFIATFLGVFFANLLWLPIAGKVKARITALEFERELVTEAVLMLAAGNSSTLLRRKLGAYFVPAASKGPDRRGRTADKKAAASPSPQAG